MKALQAVRQRIVQDTSLLAKVPVERIKIAQPTSVEKTPFVRIEAVSSEPVKVYNQMVVRKNVTVQVTVFADNIVECENLVDLLYTILFCTTEYNGKKYDILPDETTFMYDSETKYWLGIIRCDVWL